MLTYWISWLNTKKAIEPRTFGELHMNECRSFFIATMFLFHTWAWELPRFRSFLFFHRTDKRFYFGVVFFSIHFYNDENRENQAKKNELFWRHKCFMRILIEIISGMRMTSKHKQFVFYGYIFFDGEMKRIAESLWTDVIFSFFGWNWISRAVQI